MKLYHLLQQKINFTRFVTNCFRSQSIPLVMHKENTRLIQIKQNECFSQLKIISFLTMLIGMFDFLVIAVFRFNRFSY